VSSHRKHGSYSFCSRYAKEWSDCLDEQIEKRSLDIKNSNSTSK